MILLLCCLAILTGCASNSNVPPPDYKVTKKDRLTRAELANLVNHGQRFAVRSPKVKKRLTKQQQRYILNTRPVVVEKYSGYKYGLLEMRWRISKTSELVLRSKGPLNVKQQNWKLEICTTQKNGRETDGFISKDLERNIGLPPK
jgi:hypothetical protein